MDETRLRLDGNACAGLLQEVFANDMTAAMGACNGCGTLAVIGRQLLYGYPDGPGAVLRCSTCEQVLIVIVRIEEGHRLSTPGLAWVDLRQEA